MTIIMFIMTNIIIIMTTIIDKIRIIIYTRNIEGR